MQDCRLQLCGHSFVVRRHGADLQPAADHHYLDVKHLDYDHYLDVKHLDVKHLDVKHLDYDHYLDADHHCHHPTLGVLHLRSVQHPDCLPIHRGRRSFPLVAGELHTKSLPDHHHEHHRYEHDLHDHLDHDDDDSGRRGVPGLHHRHSRRHLWQHPGRQQR